ncbi:STAS domain-containing protein [Carnimonas nigrificans]|uniref:STAS domain-containing protein n=1 Tax=Carnimonas nigrificans TaxID=64323 RepID=UPI00046E99B8|nr:STAS domain-containing protein [Carnimonas nigrificans]
MSERLYHSSDVELSVSHDQLHVAGRPGFDNARALADAGTAWLARHSGSSVVLDVTATESVNSGILCVLLEWLRQARRHQVAVQQVKLPERLQELVHVSGLAPVFNAAPSLAG